MAKKSSGGSVTTIEEFRAKYSKIADGKPIEYISSGLVMLDAALGIGGFPKGRIVELFGAESSGKSTIAMATAKQCMNLGLSVLYIDFEHSMSEEYCKLFGIDAQHDPLFIYEQPGDAEEGAAITRDALATGAFGLIVWDSIAAMATRREHENPEDIQVAPLARFLAPEFRRLVPMVDEAQCILMLINHVHERIGVTGMGGRPLQTTPGGKSIKHYASVRVETKHYQQVKGRSTDFMTGKVTNDIVGSLHTATVRKNKVAMPGHHGNFCIREGWGLCEPQIVVEILVGRGLAKLAGPYYTLPGIDKKFQGLDAVLDFLRQNTDIYEKYREVVKAELQPVKNLLDVPEDEVEEYDESDGEIGD